MFDSMGFMVVNRANWGRPHTDVPGGGKHLFNFLIPLVIPENAKTELYIGTLEDKHFGPLNYTENVGILLGGDTKHATGKCDHRETRELRVVATVYINDVNEENIEILTKTDGDTAIFPGPGHPGAAWLWAQKGRFWGNGNSLANDKGRKPYTAHDFDYDCDILVAAGRCNTPPWNVRLKCPKSCGLFIDDEEYYTEVIGSVPQTIDEASL